MEQQESAWLTALGFVIDAAITGADLGILGHGIKSFASGQTPWDDPGEWTKGALKAGAIGFGSGAVTAGVGQGVGALTGSAIDAGAAAGAGGMSMPEGASALGDAGWIGEGVGSTAAEAGAATPSTVAGIIPRTAGELLKGGTQAPSGLFREALKGVVSNAAGGAVQDQENPLRGALAGAATAGVSGALNWGGNLAYKGMSSGLSGVPNPNDATRGVSLAGNPGDASRGFSLGSEGFARAAVPRSPQYSLMANQIATPAPTLMERLGRGAVSQGSQFGGNIASGAISSALTPPPRRPQSVNPYERYGYTPYWARYQS